MCGTCGCSGDEPVRLISLGAHPADEAPTPRPHDEGHAHEHAHPHGHDRATATLTLEQRVLAKNDALAERNRGWLEARGVAAVNLMSSPGSGKTTLLERTVRKLGRGLALYVVEGDQETTVDAERIRNTGCPVVQINTGAGCHLDASMFAHALRELDPTGGVIMIENVGNLVCPALFDLGEAARVVIMSVTEGADKPRKYPHMFRTASLVLLNKIDLLSYVDFDVDAFRHNLAIVNPVADVLHVSATTGAGLGTWCEWVSALLNRIPA